MQKLLFPILLIGLAFFSSCDNDDDGGYDIPTSYSAIENVSYSGQTTRLGMMDEMTAYMKTANSSGVVLNAAKLLGMYANDGNYFSSAEFNESTKELKNKTFSGDVAIFEARINAIAEVSQSSTAGSNGVAGVVTTPARTVLLNENGVELTQLIEKGLMGACFFYQISEIYLSEDKIGELVDNTIITDGEGTKMEHHWDEAFGYFGAPTDFPTNTEGIRFWAKYANGRDAILNCNETIMNAYIAGRTAISNNNDEAKWANATIIKNEIERVSAATAIHYLNDAIAKFGDDADRCHVLSEAWAFLESTKYHADGLMKVTDIEMVQSHLGDNFYEVTIDNINHAKDMISDKYGFDAFKNDL